MFVVYRHSQSMKNICKLTLDIFLILLGGEEPHLARLKLLHGSLKQFFGLGIQLNSPLQYVSAFLGVACLDRIAEKTQQPQHGTYNKTVQCEDMCIVIM